MIRVTFSEYSFETELCTSPGFTKEELLSKRISEIKEALKDKDKILSSNLYNFLLDGDLKTYDEMEAYMKNIARNSNKTIEFVPSKRMYKFHEREITRTDSNYEQLKTTLITGTLIAAELTICKHGEGDHVNDRFHERVMQIL